MSDKIKLKLILCLTLSFVGYLLALGISPGYVRPFANLAKVCAIITLLCALLKVE